MNSKVKGKRFELELAARLREAGYEARRTAQYAGNTGEAADVVGLPGIHIEAKHQETMRLYEWMEQAVRDTTNEDLPAVFHRKNRADILVTMKFDDWMQLYKCYDPGFAAEVAEWVKVIREERNGKSDSLVSAE